MTIFLICSKHFYDRLPAITEKLESLGHTCIMPNCHDDPDTEDRHRAQGTEAHAAWKGAMLKKSARTISGADAVLVLNFEKHGTANYIGGATFLEMYDAFRLQKKIFLYNPIPNGLLHDEIVGFSPVILNGILENIT